MNTKERIIKLVDALGLTKAEFERRCGLSNGYINSMRNGVGMKGLNLILEQFPSINKNWLFFGDGDMFLEEQDECDGEVNTTAKNVIRAILNKYNLTVKEFVLKANLKTIQSVYDILHGKTKTITPTIESKILSAFPDINRVWLLTGEGEMLVQPDTEPKQEEQPKVIQHPNSVKDNIGNVSISLCLSGFLGFFIFQK